MVWVDIQRYMDFNILVGEVLILSYDISTSDILPAPSFLIEKTNSMLVEILNNL